MTDKQLEQRVHYFPKAYANARKKLQELQTEAQIMRAPEADILAAVNAVWDNEVSGNG